MRLAQPGDPAIQSGDAMAGSLKREHTDAGRHSLTAATRRRFLRQQRRRRIDNRGLNFLVSRAVPFNSIFPHR